MKPRPMDTLSQAIDRLEAAGYREAFHPRGQELRAASGRSYAPEALTVDEVLRFEGASDPADESILFALRTNDGVKGTWSATYGPSRDPIEAELVRQLRRAER